MKTLSKTEVKTSPKFDSGQESTIVCITTNKALSIKKRQKPDQAVLRVHEMY